MRARYLLLLIVAPLLACSMLQTKWEAVNEGGFTVEMPGKPQKQTQTVQTAAGPIAVNMLMVDKGSEAYMVGYNDFPAQAAKPIPAETLLNNAKQGALSNVQGKVTSERSLTLNGHPGKEFVGEGTTAQTGSGTPQSADFTARIYWVAPRLYQVLYIRAKGTSGNTENRDKFLNSFKLTGEAAPAPAAK